MIFSLFIGASKPCEDWQAGLEAHARWLGFRSFIRSDPFSDGLACIWGWLLPSNVTREPALIQHPGGFEGDTWGGWSAAGNPAYFTVAGGAVTFELPPITPEQLCWVRDSRGLALANDVRLLGRWTGSKLDDRAVFALFEYRAVPPPLTIFKGVNRLPGGHSLTWRPGGEPEISRVFRVEEQGRDQDLADGPEQRLEKELDATLAGTPEGAALLFSGGVDSSLLAARFVANGRRDLRLVNYAFATDSSDGRLARRMAGALGVEMEQVDLKAWRWDAALDRLPREYSYPFGDLSLLPTHALARSAASMEAPAVLDGTGADGAFGMAGLTERWLRIQAIPRWLRILAGAAYAGLGIWQSNSGVESRFRKLRRSTQMPLDLAAVAGNTSLHGILYRMPLPIKKDLVGAFQEAVLPLADGLAPDERLSMLDLAHVCGGRFAAKTFDPLRFDGVPVQYPFLDPRMVRLGVSIGAEPAAAGGIKKGILKKLLARHVPEDLVYRKKRSFSPPQVEIFGLPALKERFEQVLLEENTPLIDFVDRKSLKRCARQALSGKPVGNAAANFLWTLFFTSIWIEGQS